MINKEYDRFRSFAERYVIERAPTFRTGFEEQDGWLAIQNAKSLYGMIADVSAQMDHPQEAQQAGVTGCVTQAIAPTQQVRPVPFTAPPSDTARRMFGWWK